MRKFLCLLVAMSLFLSGCGLLGERIKEPVTFYYLREEYQFGSTESVIGSEEREASGHRENLSYLLALYLMGPTEEHLRSPIPRGTSIYLVEQTDQSVTLKLSDSTTILSDSEFTLACTCLTLTCLELTGAETVTISSGSRNITMRRENLVFFDNNTSEPTEELQ